MKFRLPALAIALCAFAFPAAAQPAASPHFFLNGTDWNAISKLTTDDNFVKALKVYTIEGVFDGLTGLLAQNGPADFPKNTAAIADLIPHLTTGQIIDDLDTFYADTQNINVPLMLALPIIARDATGTSKSDVMTMTLTARKISSDLGNAKTQDDFAVLAQKIINNNKTGQVQAGQPKAK